MTKIKNSPTTMGTTQNTRGLTANRTGPAAVLERSSSVINSRNVQTALLISLGYHVALLVLFSTRVPLDLLEYWGFVVVDTALWIVASIPLIAIARKQLAWYDLLALLSILFFGMVCTFSLAYSLDPPFVRSVSTFDGFALRDSTESQFLQAVIKAELVLLMFLTIVLWTNRHIRNIVSMRYSPLEYRAATLTAITCVIGGSFGFLVYWSSRSFLAALTTDIGSLELKAPEAGTARYLMLVGIALAALSLGVIGTAGRPKRGRISAGGLLIASATITIIVNLWNGARGDVLFAFLMLFAVVAYFGFSIKRSTWGAMLAVVIVVIGFVTLVRLNPDISQDPKDVLSDVFSGETVRAYASQTGSSTGTLLALDRVSAVAITLEYLRLTDEYLYGETLIAGPANLLADLTPRFFGSRDIAVQPRRMANQVIFFWRYGYYGIGTAVPPSIPGEFFMQAGIVGLFFLSVLFGLLILWLRKRIAASTSLIGRWFLVVFSIGLVKTLPAELSVLAGSVVYTLLPVVVTYGGAYLVLKMGRRRGLYSAKRVVDA